MVCLWQTLATNVRLYPIFEVVSFKKNKVVELYKCDFHNKNIYLSYFYAIQNLVVQLLYVL